MGEYPKGHVDVVMVNEDLASVSLMASNSKILENAGCSVLAFEPGMEADWLRIQERADEFNSFGPNRFVEEFGDDDGKLKTRVFFLQNMKGQLVGTASAWVPQEKWGDEYGRIHWVAIVPEYQGLGLSKILVSHLIEKMKEMGYTKSYLTTNTVRAAAIALYQKFGFARLT